MNPIKGIALFVLTFLTLSASANLTIAADNHIKGTLVYKTYSVPFKYAWLVKGPGEMDSGKTIRRLILSATDIGAKLQACVTMSCTDGQVTEGMTMDFDIPPRLAYWLAVNDGKVQYSFGVSPDAFSAHIDDPGHLAGKLQFDDSSAGGPKVDTEFDLTVFKEIKAN